MRLTERDAGFPVPEAVTETLARPAGSLTGTTAVRIPAGSEYAREATSFHLQRVRTHFCEETATVAREAPVATPLTASLR